MSSRIDIKTWTARERSGKTMGGIDVRIIRKGKVVEQREVHHPDLFDSKEEAEKAMVAWGNEIRAAALASGGRILDILKGRPAPGATGSEGGE